MNPEQSPGAGAGYRIVVQGRLDPGWSSWFSGMRIELVGACNGALLTALAGPVTDQAALRGIVNTLWDLNLTLISLERLDAGSPQGGES